MSVAASLREDIDAIMERDPAARSRLEVVLCYPGFLWLAPADRRQTLATEF